MSCTTTITDTGASLINQGLPHHSPIFTQSLQGGDQASPHAHAQSLHGANLRLRLRAQSLLAPPWTRHRCSGLSRNSTAPFTFCSSPWSALDVVSLQLECFNRPFRFRAALCRQISSQVLDGIEAQGPSGAPSSPHPPAAPASGPHDDEAGWSTGIAHTGLSSGAELRCHQMPCYQVTGSKPHIPHVLHSNTPLGSPFSPALGS